MEDPFDDFYQDEPTDLNHDLDEDPYLCIDDKIPMELNYAENIYVCNICGYTVTALNTSYNSFADFHHKGNITQNFKIIGQLKYATVSNKELVDSFSHNNYNSDNISELCRLWLKSDYDNDLDVIVDTISLLSKMRNSGKIIKRQGPFTKILAATMYYMYIDNHKPKKQKTLSIMTGLDMAVIGDGISKFNEYCNKYNFYNITSYSDKGVQEYDFIIQYLNLLNVKPEKKYINFIIDIYLKTKPGLIRKANNTARPTTKCVAGIVLLATRLPEDLMLTRQMISDKCNISISTYINFVKFIENEIIKLNYHIIKIFMENDLPLYKVRNII
jgi:hypothetical protein